jgi:hypothetical protein
MEHRTEYSVSFMTYQGLVEFNQPTWFGYLVVINKGDQFRSGLGDGPISGAGDILNWFNQISGRNPI